MVIKLRRLVPNCSQNEWEYKLHAVVGGESNLVAWADRK
jgi:hypothetical protein